MVRRWYQTIEIDSEEQVFEDINRKDSKFWNEGKWDSFIKPLLPEYRGTFLEIGCNAGLFLKKAQDYGFRNIVGVEGNRQIFQQAESYRQFNGGNYRLVHQTVGKNLELEDLPLADVVLFSNMHYYLPVGVFATLVDRLRTRALYCIVVSAKAKRRQGNALYDINSVRGYFRDWEHFPAIISVDAEGDPCPRPDMYGALFRGGLDVCYVDKVYDDWREAAKKLGHRSYKLAPVMEDFFALVLTEDSGFRYDDTKFYQYWRERLPKKSSEWTVKLLKYKAELALDIKENGIKEPIYFNKEGKLLDGIHRLCIAKLLGYEHILSRIL